MGVLLRFGPLTITGKIRDWPDGDRSNISPGSCPPTREVQMKTTTIIVSVVLAVVAAVVHFAKIEHPVFPTRGFVLLLVGYLVLLAGNLLGM
jgi:hypothetical protein